MRVDRPGPGEELNEGETVADAREAASAILLRDGDDGPEVLLLQRNPESRFMGGAWVFPGGAVHADDEADEHPGPWRRDARDRGGGRASRSADPDALVPFSRWITPAEVKIRFDTWFFVARAPDGAEAEGRRRRGASTSAGCARRTRSSSTSATSCCSSSPRSSTSSSWREFDSVDDALDDARARQVQPVQPRVLVDGGVARVLMPGEPGYDDDAEHLARRPAGSLMTCVSVQLGHRFFALATAFASIVGFLYKHRGAVESPPIEWRRPIRTSLALFRSRWYVLGILIAIGSWGFHVAALALAPISLVQSVIAGGLVLLTVVADRLFGFTVTRREWIGVALTAAGLAFLAATLGEHRRASATRDYDTADARALRRRRACCRRDRRARPRGRRRRARMLARLGRA